MLPKSDIEICSSRFAIIALAYLAHSWFIQACLKPSLLHFRIGEGRLVHWAEEDIVVLEDEEDVMVNANEFEWGATEDIPLKPSPKRLGRSFLAKYGSA